MEAMGLLVMLEARRGKEDDAEAFLKSAQPFALDEKRTVKWYAIKLGPLAVPPQTEKVEVLATTPLKG